MATDSFITKTNAPLPSQDYSFLREEGLKHIEALASKIWTDYNDHDPGITMLELLCYAVTDLGHRTGLETRDILAQDPLGPPAYDKNYYTAQAILPNSPFTVTDFRKALMDIDGIANAWVRPKAGPNTEVAWYVDYVNSQFTHSAPLTANRDFDYLNGLYEVVIEFEHDLLISSTTDPDETAKVASQDNIVTQAKALMHTMRNLCEEMAVVEKAKGVEQITLNANVEVTGDANPSDVMAEVYYRIEKFLQPTANFYSLAEMLDQGLTIDQIFEGPVTQNGFMLDSEIEAIEKRDTLYASDLIQIIMDIPGVEGVNELTLDSKVVFYNPSTMDFEEYSQTDHDGSFVAQEWSLDLLSGAEITLPGEPDPGDYQLVLNALDDETVTLQRGWTTVTMSAAELEDAVERYEQLHLADRNSRREGQTEDLDVPEGEFSDLEDYLPVQNELPLVYGVGPAGLPDSATDKRKGQAKQLKAYLLFFEQLLANYFSQLKNVRLLLSWDDTVTQTYFTQVISGIDPDDELFEGGAGLSPSVLKEMVEASGSGAYETRRNRLLDHLIGRFNEMMTDYSILMYGIGQGDEVLADKMAMLDDYDFISMNRLRSFDYTNLAEVWDTDNVTGLERRVCRLLGIDDFQRRNLLTTEGMHVVEHVLLRPRTGSDPFLNIDTGATAALTCPPDEDPYSFRITVFLPGEVGRFTDYRFRFYAEELIRMETPAHIAVDVKFLTDSDMAAFETCWEAFLTDLATVESPPTLDLTCIVGHINNLTDMYDAVYTVEAAQNEDSYTASELMASVSDPVGTIVHAAYWGGSGPILIQGGGLPTAVPDPVLGLNTSNGNINLLPGAEGTLSGGVFTPGFLAQYTVDDTGAGVDAVWLMRIDTTNDVGGSTRHEFHIRVINDRESLYTTFPKSEDAYSVSDNLATVADPDNTMQSATIASGSLQSWMAFDTVTGAFTVSSLPVAAGSWAYVVTTQDNDGGYTVHNVLIEVYEDQEAVYSYSVGCSAGRPRMNVDVFDTNGQTVATVADPDGAITAAVLANSTTLPAFFDLNGTTGEITLNNTEFLSSGRWVIPGQYAAQIQTTDALGGITLHNVNFNIVKDREAVWTLESGHSINCYCPGDIVGVAVDPDGPIVSATVTAGSLPPGMILNSEGTLEVGPYTGSVIPSGQSGSGFRTSGSHAAEAQNRGGGSVPLIPEPCLNDLVAGTYSFTVQTTDQCGGITDTAITFTVFADRKAVYNMEPLRSFHTYRNGDLLGTPTDPDGPIVYAELASGSAALPDGVALNRINGVLTVSDERAFQAFFDGGQSVQVTIRLVDECGGETEVDVVITTLLDTASVYSIGLNQTLYAGRYGVGDVVASVTDADQTPANQFLRVEIVSGNFIEGAELDPVTGEIRVADPMGNTGSNGPVTNQ